MRSLRRVYQKCNLYHKRVSNVIPSTCASAMWSLGRAHQQVISTTCVPKMRSFGRGCQQRDIHDVGIGNSISTTWESENVRLRFYFFHVFLRIAQGTRTPTEHYHLGQQAIVFRRTIQQLLQIANGCAWVVSLELQHESRDIGCKLRSVVHRKSHMCLHP